MKQEQTIREGDIRWIYDPTDTEIRLYQEIAQQSKHDPLSFEFVRTGLVQWMKKEPPQDIK